MAIKYFRRNLCRGGNGIYKGQGIVRRPVKRKEILLYIPGVPAVCSTVHMDGDGGNDECRPIEIDQFGNEFSIFRNDDTACCRQGAVEHVDMIMPP